MLHYLKSDIRTANIIRHFKITSILFNWLFTDDEMLAISVSINNEILSNINGFILEIYYLSVYSYGCEYMIYSICFIVIFKM